MREIALGTSHTFSLTVIEAHTAIALGSGNLAVLGTPAMIAWMERAAMEAIAPHLDTQTESSVGVALNVEHTRASGIGELITATAIVTDVEGRRVNFDVSAVDSDGHIIGRGTHSRFVVDVEKFMNKIKK